MTFCGIRQRRRMAAALAMSFATSVASLAPVAASEGEQVSVLSRNIYLGADVAVALQEATQWVCRSSPFGWTMPRERAHSMHSHVGPWR